MENKKWSQFIIDEQHINEFGDFKFNVKRGNTISDVFINMLDYFETYGIKNMKEIEETANKARKEFVEWIEYNKKEVEKAGYDAYGDKSLFVVIANGEPKIIFNTKENELEISCKVGFAAIDLNEKMEDK